MQRLVIIILMIMKMGILFIVKIFVLFPIIRPLSKKIKKTALREEWWSWWSWSSSSSWCSWSSWRWGSFLAPKLRSSWLTSFAVRPLPTSPPLPSLGSNNTGSIGSMRLPCKGSVRSSRLCKGSSRLWLPFFVMSLERFSAWKQSNLQRYKRRYKRR